MPDKNKKLWTSVSVGLLLLGVIGAAIIIKSRPQTERRRMPAMTPVVEATKLSPITTSVTVRCLGTVIADRDVSLQAEVSGRILSVKPDLIEGTFVREGEILIVINPVDYELAVRQAQAALHTAEGSLRQEEGRQAAARHEMSLIRENTEIDSAYRDLMLRAPQLKAAKAAVQSAQAALDKAEENVSRTKIRAPFDGVIKTAAVKEGDYASSGRTLISLVATDRFFVRASLPVSSLAMFEAAGENPYPAEVVMTDGEVRNGVLYRVLPDLSSQGRMARVLVAVENPYSSDKAGRPMLLGESVRVNLSGRRFENVYLVDRSAVRDGDVLWMMDPGEKLRIVSAGVLQGYDDQLLVSLDFPAEWNLITSGIPAPVEGMKLQMADTDRKERK